ncbi:MAG: hypothetical protein JWM98_287 [Thermoleophilia bacterium]|nr:hypothetical protein [Thermoleophilia bacterium]
MPADVHLTDHARKRLYERAAARTPRIMELLGTRPVSKEPPMWINGSSLAQHEYFVHLDDRTSAIVSSREPDRMRVVVTLLTLEGLSEGGERARWRRS